jgi:hypothetical protein
MTQGVKNGLLLAIRSGSAIFSIQDGYKATRVCSAYWQNVLGASWRTHIIAFPFDSISGSRPKSLLIDSAHRRGLGRVLRSCSKMAKTALKLSGIVRGADGPKFLTACR